MSPSTRKAWIEINKNGVESEVNGSPSTRKAWIEMMMIFEVAA